MYNTAKLSKILSPVERPEIPLAGNVYRQVGVRLWGQGAYERESMDGGDTQYRTLNRVELGDIIVNKIWARNGSVSVVWEDTAGCYASGEFPLFVADQSKLNPRWFFLLTRTPDFWHQCEEKSFGTSGKNRIRPEKFLEIEIPLPPLDEQRRIVAHIDALAARIAEARGLRIGAVEEAEAFLVSVRRHVFTSLTNAPVVHFETACNAIIDNLHSNPTYADDGIYPCIRSSDVGWGELFLETARRTDQAEYLRRTVRGAPQVDDIVLVREGGGTGKAAAVSEGQVFSLGQRVMMVRPNQQQVLPRFMLNQMLSPLIYDDQILPQSKGSASPHLNISALRKFRFVLPPLDEQRRIVAYLDELQARVDALKRLQQETAAELDALLPSVLDRAFKGEL